VVKHLLDAGADTEAVMPLNGSTSLYIASQKGHSEVVRHLLDAGADKGATLTCGYASLDIALELGHSEVVNILRNADHLD
jgi:ankyrin repeat protein